MQGVGAARHDAGVQGWQGPPRVFRPMVHQGRAASGAAAPATSAEKRGRWSCRVPDNSGRQRYDEGSRALPGRRRNEPGRACAEPGSRNGARRIHLPWEVYLCALSKIRRVGRAKTPTKTIARRVQTDIANNKKQIKQRGDIQCRQQGRKQMQ